MKSVVLHGKVKIAGEPEPIPIAIYVGGFIDFLQALNYKKKKESVWHEKFRNKIEPSICRYVSRYSLTNTGYKRYADRMQLGFNETITIDDPAEEHLPLEEKKKSLGCMEYAG